MDEPNMRVDGQEFEGLLRWVVIRNVADFGTNEHAMRSSEPMVRAGFGTLSTPSLLPTINTTV